MHVARELCHQNQTLPLNSTLWWAYDSDLGHLRVFLPSFCSFELIPVYSHAHLEEYREKQQPPRVPS